MIEFLTVLIFAKTIALTPSPIDLNGHRLLAPEERMEALTSGAGVEIDVTGLIPPSYPRPFDIIETPKLLRGAVPLGSVKVALVGPNEESLELEDSGFSISSDGARLIFSAPRKMPARTSWKAISIDCSVKISQARIYWKNARL